MKISSIVIVGGEIESWLTAAILLKKNSNIKVTIIQTKKRSEIGVGKSSATNIFSLLQMFSFEDSSWMKECDATYSLGYEYYNFAGESSYFQQPFGPISIPESKNFSLEYVPLFDMKKVYSKEITNNDLLHFVSPVSFMITRNKLAPTISEITEDAQNIPLKHLTSYHFDGNKFVDLISKSCKDQVTVFSVSSENEIDIHWNKKGIEHISIDNLIGTKIYGDLYIDCSEEKTLSGDDGHFHCSESLFNDRTIRFSIPYKDSESRIKHLKNSTSIVALDNGSAKKMSLWNSCEFEYNYSSILTEKKDMIKSLTANYGQIDYYETEGKQGYYSNALDKNVYSIGNSYARIEGLSSDNFDLIIQGCLELTNIMTQTEFILSNVKRFSINESYREYCKKHLDLVTYTYLFSDRKDTPYWEQVTSDENFDHSVKLFQNFYRIQKSNMLMNDPVLFTLSLGYDAASPQTTFDVLSIIRGNSQFKSHMDFLYKGYKSYMEASEQKIGQFSDTYHFTKDHVYEQPDTE
jgi:tryptophan 7-halogenase